MRARTTFGAVTAIALAAGLAAFAGAPRTRAPEPAPQVQALQEAEKEAAVLEVRVSALPQRDRRAAETLLRDSSSRLAGAKELAPSDDPRLARYARHLADAAGSRIDEARRLVDRGGAR